jgi:exopolysaccharide production protein ExoQ
MPSSIATVACGFCIVALFLFDRDRKSPVSSALWIPVVWLLFGASRPVSQWLGSRLEQSPEPFLEGQPLDALIFAGLLAAGLSVLLARRWRARTFWRANGPLLGFFLYCAVSVLWSPYPFVAFKRWTKFAGDLVMVLVVLTDPKPTTAVGRLLGRPGFVLIPLSILLIKYYPDLGRQYSAWTGEAYNIGAGTQKNDLGRICLIFGLGSCWYLLDAFRGRERARPAGPLIAHGAVLVAVALWLFWMADSTPFGWFVIASSLAGGLGSFWYLLDAFRGGERARPAGPAIAHGAVLAMALWLFRMADSATSFGCFLVASSLMGVTSLRRIGRNPAVVHFLVGAVLFVALYGLVLHPEAGLTEVAGRSSTLSGRTELWAQFLQVQQNPWFGAGFESFWVGPHLQEIWRTWGRLNQAHNGYLDVFLNLGWVGTALLGLVIVWGYGNAVRALRRDPEAGSLKLALFVVALIYNLTEHGFRELHPMWIMFLLAITVVPEPDAEDRPSIETASQWRWPLAETALN